MTVRYTDEIERYKHTCEVGGRKFYFLQISPRQLRSIFLNVTGKVLKTISPKFENISESANLFDKDIMSMIDVNHTLQNIERVLTEDQIEEIEKVLFSQCTCDYVNNEGVVKNVFVLEFYDRIFADNFMDSFQLLKEAFKCYYESFFVKAGTLINSDMSLNGTENTKKKVSGLKAK